MALRLNIEHNLDEQAQDLKRKLSNAGPVFKRFAQYMRVRTDATFEHLRRGGTYRGVSWDYFAPQYRRKTDGVEVPAWGGVPKLRGRGVVQGRLRPSGARVQAGDSVVQDTGTLRSRAALVMGLTRKVLTLGPQGVRYAGAQQARRPFLFFDVPRDSDALEKFAQQHIEGK